MLAGDRVFQELVVQRSRAYVEKSQEQQGASVAMFPTREPPVVADYSVKRTYGRLLDMVEKAFRKDKPLFTLGIYYPLAYYNGSDKMADSRSKMDREPAEAGLRSDPHPVPQAVREFRLRLRAVVQPPAC